MSRTVRLLYLAHRYLGIALAVPMLAWCLSGVVMMYVAYPAMPEGDRLAHLNRLDWSRCCSVSDVSLPDDTAVRQMQVEMVAGHPVLRARMGDGAQRVIDLTDGAVIGRITEGQAGAVAGFFGRVTSIDQLASDQWTVGGEFNRDRPLFHASLAGVEGLDLYVSSATGKAVQITNRKEKFWNWLGAVPHWIYFAALRRNVTLWSQVVTWLSLIGSLLTATGIYIGIRQFRRRPAGRWSGHKGVKLWHHVPGLIFGLFTLTWVVSGFLSMNPWGALEGGGTLWERTRLQGLDLTGGLVKQVVRGLSAARRDTDDVSIEAAPFDGSFALVTTSADGHRRRLDGSGNRLPAADIGRAVPLLGGTDKARLELLDREDGYYFAHHRETAPLPAYRLTLDDGRRFYLDPLSGTILRSVDAADRGYRWLHQAPHRLDFDPILRSRPLWDMVMLILLAGVSASAGTGLYLAIRRLARRRPQGQETRSE